MNKDREKNTTLIIVHQPTSYWAVGFPSFFSSNKMFYVYYVANAYENLST